MTLTVADLHTITGHKRHSDRKEAFLAALAMFGGDMLAPHVLAQITAQILHESGAFKHVEELASGAAYEMRSDLGNVHKGDGAKFKGRGLIQVTGRSNYSALTRWAATALKSNVDFVKSPELVSSPKWLAIGVVWYFQTRAGLMDYCRAGNIEMVTRRVNGGLNGYADRLEWYDKTCCAMLGHPDIKSAQAALGVAVDGISGPVTRAAMHDKLKSWAAVRPAPAIPAKGGALAAIIAAILSILKGAKK